MILEKMAKEGHLKILSSTKTMKKLAKIFRINFFFQNFAN